MASELDPPGASADGMGTPGSPEGGSALDVQSHSRNVVFISHDPSFDIDEAFLSEEDEPETINRPVAAVPGVTAAQQHYPTSAQETAWPDPVSTEPLPVLDDPDDEWSSSLPPGGALSISELLENGVAVDWHEAVAIARRICQTIGRHPSAGTHEYVLDPRHIEITERGEVHVLPGAPGGDPFVKQVGRILRALLENGTAPVPLRLLASQASFELPGFESVHDLSEALRAYDAPQEDEAIRTAFKRGLGMKFSQPPEPDWSPPQMSMALSSTASAITWDEIIPKRRSWNSRRLAMAAGLSIVLVAIVALEIARRVFSPAVTPTIDVQSALNQLPRLGVRTDSDPTTSPSEVVPAPELEPEQSPPVSPQAESAVSPQTRPVAPPRPQPVNRPEETAASLVRAATNKGTDVESRAPDGPVSPSAANRADARRREFDTLVLANPLYRLDSAAATPEAVAALRDSKRLLLPSLARRDASRALEALNRGDSDRALSDATRVVAMIEDENFGPVPEGLSDTVRQILTQARAAKAREESRVYSTGDLGVVPPLPRGRQLPASGPSGISSGLVGQLELLVGRDGEVEAVKLHTPLNRYHERMIVSAAKAWKYEPATKDGKSVRFRLFRSVTLPED